MALARRRVGRHLIVYDQATSRRLARFGHEASEPERIVRRLLSSRGLRFRTSNRDLPGSPDVANRSKKWVVFVHGCYWHHHAGCRRATVPTRNRAFWLSKFRDNRRRDRRVVSELEAMGFLVAVVWECEAESSGTLLKRLSSVLRSPRRSQRFSRRRDRRRSSRAAPARVLGCVPPRAAAIPAVQKATRPSSLIGSSSPTD